MATSLPFKAEYAKSGRASCKMCKTPIDKGTLRMAIMVQSRFHDGKDAHWFHDRCFFQKHRPESVGDIEDFESLRYEDQTKIKENMAGGGGAASGGSSKKGKGGGAAKGGGSSGDFSVGYAKTAASKCGACEEKIGKGEIRVSKRDYTSERAIIYSAGKGFEKWHHLDCFVKIREDLDFLSEASKNSLPGFQDLDREDQQKVKEALPAISSQKRKLDNGSNGDVPAKKIKTEKGIKAENSDEAIIAKQNKEMYKNRDLAEAQLKKPELSEILSKNNQEIPDVTKGGPKAVLDLVADILTFGAMKKCSDCKSGQFMYKSGVGYQCTGYINEFTKCDFVPEGDVPRVEFKIPRDLREHPFFDKRKFKIQKRVIPKHAAPVKALASTSTKAGPKIIRKPLKGFKFNVLGIKGAELHRLEKKIEEFGGAVTSKTSASLAVAIMDTKEFNDTSKYVERAKKYGVPVVSVDFVDNITDVNYKLADELSKYLLSDWVKDIRGRLKNLNEEFEKPKEEKKSILEQEMSTVKLKMKDGAVIDPQSGLDDGPYHIYKEGSIVYNCVLNKTIVEEGKNSFYKIQIIESDNAPKEYHVFRSWGRIGTTIGGSQTDQHSKQDAIDLFLEKYEELTGNVWGRKFVKKPGLYIRLDIDYGEKERGVKLIPSTATSKLPMPVQSLVSLIFDVDVMKRTLLEFEIDMNKMPLGKISRKQLLEAYSVLNDSTNMRIEEKDERKLQRRITDVSNRFYNLIPHNFGTKMPPLLDNDELLRAKIEMLDNLMEIELAYELLAKGEEGGQSIDSHYKTLCAEIDILEAHSEEFKIIEKYLMNTHAPTHTNYTLSIDQVFKVNRKGENKRYRPFKDLHNRMLLWHGSRVSNFAGIISQGLRIAPPEAPVTGYMFGKGVYFADMVSKSANYCNTSGDNPTGLLLLCEVALGDMHELKHAKDTIIKPPKNNHSVKGLGETVPDPKEVHKFSDGVVVPYGKPTKAKLNNTSLLYNEYIVYDVAQVNIKYLLRVNFNYNRRR